MPFTLDNQPLTITLPDDATLAAALDAIRNMLLPLGRVIVKIDRDGQTLLGPELAAAQEFPIVHSTIALTTMPRTQLAEAMIGKLAALVEYLSGQHISIAQLIEQGQVPKAMEKLGSALNAWHQIQQAYSSLAALLQVNLDAMKVGEIPATHVIREFHRQLTEIQQALLAHDMVLLGDILQYEMEGAIRNWTGLLESTLGITYDLKNSSPANNTVALAS